MWGRGCPPSPSTLGLVCCASIFIYAHLLSSPSSAVAAAASVQDGDYKRLIDSVSEQVKDCHDLAERFKQQVRGQAEKGVSAAGGAPWPTSFL